MACCGSTSDQGHRSVALVSRRPRGRRSHAQQPAPKDPWVEDPHWGCDAATARGYRQGTAEPVPAGSDVSSGMYKCTSCGYPLDVGSTKHLPPCPSCHNGYWESLSGGDSVDDAYPDRPECS
jgi:hypothetical protein